MENTPLCYIVPNCNIDQRQTDGNRRPTPPTAQSCAYTYMLIFGRADRPHPLTLYTRQTTFSRLFQKIEKIVLTNGAACAILCSVGRPPTPILSVTLYRQHKQRMHPSGRKKGATIMLYTIIITHADGTQTATHTTADGAKQAHEHGAQIATSKGDQIRVYATTQDEHGNPIVDGIRAGALTVIKRTTANMVMREGGDLQYKLYNECRRPHTDDPDTLDCISVATLALFEGIADGDPIDEQYHRAYLALNKHLRANKQINLSATAMRTIYIEDINGDIINVYGEVNRILAPGERYTPIDEDENTADTTAEQRRIIHTITATLTPTQIKVLSYMARGYSNHQIADAMHRDRKTIIEHIRKIQAKAQDLFPNGYKTITE